MSNASDPPPPFSQPERRRHSRPLRSVALAVMPAVSLCGPAVAEKAPRHPKPPAPPAAASGDAREQQEQHVIHEIEGFLEAAEDLEKKLDAQSRLLQGYYKTTEGRRRAYAQVARTFGPESAEARLEAHKLESAYEALYAQVSARDHLRFQLQNLERAIQDRRYALRSKNVPSVWK